MKRKMRPRASCAFFALIAFSGCTVASGSNSASINTPNPSTSNALKLPTVEEIQNNLVANSGAAGHWIWARSANGSSTTSLPAVRPNHLVIGFSCIGNQNRLDIKIVNKKSKKSIFWTAMANCSGDIGAASKILHTVQSDDEVLEIHTTTSTSWSVVVSSIS